MIIKKRSYNWKYAMHIIYFLFVEITCIKAIDYALPYYLLFQSLAELLHSMLYEACYQYHLKFKLHRF